MMRDSWVFWGASKGGMLSAATGKDRCGRMLRSAWRGTLRLQRFLMDEMLKPYRWGNEKLIKGSLINSEGVMRRGKPSPPSYRIIFLSSPEKSFPGSPWPSWVLEWGEQQSLSTCDTLICPAQTHPGLGQQAWRPYLGREESWGTLCSQNG